MEPPPSRWHLPDPTGWPPGAQTLAVGADLAPSTLLAGYRRGLFPMPDGRRLRWWSPDPRGVIDPDDFRPSRSLRRSMRSFDIRVDTAFDEVVAACADSARPGFWITGAYRRSYLRLHGYGWAHSVEVWRSGELVGGLFGIDLPGVFIAESKFHRATDASKAAVAALVHHVVSAPGSGRVIDVQWATPHLLRLGAREISRTEYLRRLRDGAGLLPVYQPQ